MKQYISHDFKHILKKYKTDIAYWYVENRSKHPLSIKHQKAI
jgi:hypothetical protein